MRKLASSVFKRITSDFRFPFIVTVFLTSPPSLIRLSLLIIESQDLGISQISKTLTQITKKTPQVSCFFLPFLLHTLLNFAALPQFQLLQQRNPRPIDKALSATAEPRRSSRVRTVISSYRDDVIFPDVSLIL